MKTHQCDCGKETEQDKYERIQKVIDRYKDREGGLIQVLHLAQGIYGYLPSKLQEFIAEGLDVPLTEVYGVVTFYSMFTTIPRGRYTIRTCMGTACYVKGAEKLIDKIEEKLGIKIGETTEDGNFTLEVTRCIGACGLAPVLTINDKVYQKMTPDKVNNVLEQYMENEVAV